MATTTTQQPGRQRAHCVNDQLICDCRISDIHHLPRKGRTRSSHSQCTPSSSRRRLRKKPQMSNRFPFQPTKITLTHCWPPQITPRPRRLFRTVKRYAPLR